ETADAGERLKLIEMAIKGNKNFESSDIEIKNSRFAKSYTVDTLQSLSEQYKKDSVKFYLIIGMDNLIELHTWKEPEKLFSYAEVIVLNRPGYSVNDVKNNFVKQVRVMTVSNIDISSTSIRNKIKEKKSIKYLVSESVEKYILENKLYI
ncbi:MAG: nicotinate (nicotinamide) nucleotide adenylyltransferase, partial [Ignavibacteria bacterium]